MDGEHKDGVIFRRLTINTYRRGEGAEGAEGADEADGGDGGV